MKRTPVRVGDRVAWREVPDGALVQEDGARDMIIRIAGGGERVCIAGRWSRLPAGVNRWPWMLQESGLVSIVALKVPAAASVEELQRHAETFEIRDLLDHATGGENAGLWIASEEDLSITLNLDNWQPLEVVQLDGEAEVDFLDVLQAAAEKLHRLGWRAGQSATRAAILLATEDQ